MVSTLTLIYKSSILRFKPQIFDAINPDAPILSTPMVHLVAAEILRDMETLIEDAISQESVMNISKKLLKTSFEGLTSIWDSNEVLIEEKNKWFNPWPKWLEILGPQPEPWSTDGEIEGPRPEPWEEGSATEQIVLANLLMRLAENSDLVEFSDELKIIASNIVKQEANNLIEEFSLLKH